MPGRGGGLRRRMPGRRSIAQPADSIWRALLNPRDPPPGSSTRWACACRGSCRGWRRMRRMRRCRRKPGSPTTRSRTPRSNGIESKPRRSAAGRRAPLGIASEPLALGFTPLVLRTGPPTGTAGAGRASSSPGPGQDAPRWLAF